MWYELKDIRRDSPHRIAAVVEVPSGSPWFRGHFPGDPILPGVALVAMVHDVIRRTAGADRPVQALKRVRFKQIVRPGDRLRITISLAPGGVENGSFQITCGGEAICSGRMVFMNHGQNTEN